ncbi:hypothetical protein C1886_06980 [Pseudomonas sp. FW300-N1A1]|uniref:hypothetical protein n=1 Tax=Pseudomonas sp. FW300-N1A1 TaxID=2075555 RepID=UPI000CD0D55A|nr:hypothetical protein [Pseudomonas sp. FW300-N1A1]POA20908.1 hypothetical protein C1886_06980 [Pseudomonas sp. FW300-N1A1]
MSDIELAIIAVFILVFLFLSLFWILVSSCKFTELIENHLSKSKFVANNREAFSSAGLLGKTIRNGSMTLLFLTPRLCERRGLIEKNELLNLPTDLKRKLLAPWITGAIWFSALTFFWFFFV